MQTQETQAVQPATFAVTHANTVQMLDLRYALSMDVCCIVDLTECDHASKHTVWNAIAGAIRRGVAVTVRVREGSQPHTSLMTLGFARHCENCEMEVVG
jgi:hypothetical protein